MKKPNNQQGFTLIELMMGLLILSIIMSLAVPSFVDTIERNRREGIYTDLAGDILKARSESVRSNRETTLCASADPSAVNPTCSGGGWETGWVVLVQGNPVPFAVHGAVDTNYTLTPSAGAGSSIVFRATGDVKTGGGKFTICSPDGDDTHAKHLQLTAVGQLRPTDTGEACP